MGFFKRQMEATIVKLRQSIFQLSSAKLKLKTQIELNQTTAIISNLQQKLCALESRISNYRMRQVKLNATKSQRQLQEIIDDIDASSTVMGFFAQMEEKVMQLEAESQAIAELGGIGLEQQFALLEASSGVDDELEAIKAQLSDKNYSNKESLPALDFGTSYEDDIDAELEELRTQLNDD